MRSQRQFGRLLSSTDSIGNPVFDIKKHRQIPPVFCQDLVHSNKGRNRNRKSGTPDLSLKTVSQQVWYFYFCETGIFHVSSILQDVVNDSRKITP